MFCHNGYFKLILFFHYLKKRTAKSTQVVTDAKATERSKSAGLAYFVLTRARKGQHSLFIQRFTRLPMPAKIRG